jgi:hypothetical protein
MTDYHRHLKKKTLAEIPSNPVALDVDLQIISFSINSEVTPFIA